ncbi:MAG TPA: prolyl oligopeptidase family serine peptidase, partial [Blastocatellia bacterium]|nr:prolyl oligopeptidase family serine peptidase [Blastocatellia bacterium]
MNKARGFAFLLILILLNGQAAHAQQVPFLQEFFSRAGQVYKLYNAQLKKGANLGAFDSLRKRAEDAFRKGSIPSIIELLGEGQALLEGRPWDEKQRFLSSLTIETDRAVIEPNQELQVSLVRIYPTAPEKALGASPTVTFEVVPEPATRESNGPVAASPVLIARRLPVADVATGAGRRLLLADGTYWVVATIEVEGKKVGQAKRAVYAVGDFSNQVASFARRIDALKRSTDPKVKSVSAHISTPEFQLHRLAALSKSLGEDEVNAIGEIDRIETTLAALEKGADPFASERGELERAYTTSDGKLVPYRVYIPRSYDGKTIRPLVILLHGVLGDEKYYFSDMFDAETIRVEAERRGYILAGTNGRGRFGNTGATAQEDTFEVIKAVTGSYKIDSARIYLTGHSMGGLGTWLTAWSKPEVFAAIAPVSSGLPGQGDPLMSILSKLKSVPVLVVAGGRDGLVPPERSKDSVAAAKKAGLEVSYLEIPEADHVTIVGASFSAVLDFFEKHSKQS